MKILNLLSSGGTGGIEVLCKEILFNSNEGFDNRICCMFEEGAIYEEIKKFDKNKIFSLKNKNRNKNAIVNEIIDYCNREKIEIIVVHHGGLSCNLIYIKLKKKLPNVKFVRYLHGCFDNYSFGNDGNFIKRFVVKKVMQKALHVSDLIIFISNAAKKSFFNNFNINNNKCRIIYNGIERKFYERNNNTIKKCTNNVVFVGRLTKVKGVDVLIDAFNIIKQKGIDSTLTIVGDGEEKNELIEKVSNYGLGNNVIFTGRQSNVIQYLDSADIFIYPSIWEEGFGISVVEAMARGCIPITFNKGGLPEIIENGKNGFIVNDVSQEALANKIIEVINLKNKDEIRKNAIETAKKFSIDNTIRCQKDIFEKIIK